MRKKKIHVTDILASTTGNFLVRGLEMMPQEYAMFTGWINRVMNGTDDKPFTIFYGLENEKTLVLFPESFKQGMFTLSTTEREVYGD